MPPRPGCTRPAESNWISRGILTPKERALCPGAGRPSSAGVIALKNTKSIIVAPGAELQRLLFSVQFGRDHPGTISSQLFFYPIESQSGPCRRRRRFFDSQSH